VQYYAPVVVAGPSNPSIREKFGVIATEKEGVIATFTALHVFIAGDGLTDNPGTIKLGDWIDMDTLTVTPYNGATGTDEMNNLLWLPAEREMFGDLSYPSSTQETDENQARLQYYPAYDNGYRVK
jgi:hypothetical protein